MMVRGEDGVGGVGVVDDAGVMGATAVGVVSGDGLLVGWWWWQRRTERATRGEAGPKVAAGERGRERG